MYIYVMAAPAYGYMPRAIIFRTIKHKLLILHALGRNIAKAFFPVLFVF
jgi:hypothetical protein